MANLTPAQYDALIDRHFQYEAEDDVDGVLSTLTDDLTHDLVGWPSGASRTKDQARAFYERMFADLAGEGITKVRRLYGEGFVVDESIWHGRAVGHPLGLPGHDRPLSFRILHIFEVEPDGKIRRENVWLDTAAILQQLSEPVAAQH
ncbi:nuclear transport factor 2 family protein [Massilia niastensis]|uniref:nuclear transport factor 2 family protein n=1 Tax=Massilia niastensis TaxID=544911 RepID=UPI0003630813|nr:ester cyclase [Massilia niastensis]